MKKKNLMKGNLSVSESSEPLNNPLVSTKIAYEAWFLRYFNFGLLDGWRHLWIELFSYLKLPDLDTWIGLQN